MYCDFMYNVNAVYESLPLDYVQFNRKIRPREGEIQIRIQGVGDFTLDSVCHNVGINVDKGSYEVTISYGSQYVSKIIQLQKHAFYDISLEKATGALQVYEVDEKNYTIPKVTPSGAVSLALSLLANILALILRLRIDTEETIYARVVLLLIGVAFVAAMGSSFYTNMRFGKSDILTKCGIYLTMAAFVLFAALS